jgi:hypothetical protein
MGSICKHYSIISCLSKLDRDALLALAKISPSFSFYYSNRVLEIFRIENGRVAEIWGAGTLRQPDA